MAAAAADIEGLSVVLNAKIDEFKRGMNQAVRDFDSDANKIDSRNQQLTQSIERNMREAATATTFLTSAFKQLLGFEALKRIAEAAIDANLEIAKMTRTAELAGVSFEKLQESQYAFKRLGGADPKSVETTAHDLALKAQAEQREGEGELTNLLAANNMKLLDRNGKVKDFNELMLMAADLLGRTRTEAEAIDIGKVFNLTEEQVRALSKGVGAFTRMQQEAKSAGAVMDEELVQKAVEFDKLWSESWAKFPTYAKAAAIEAIKALTPFGTYLEDLFSKIPGMAKAVIQSGGSSTESLEDAQAALAHQIKMSPDDMGAIRQVQTRVAQAQERAAQADARRRLAEGLTKYEEDAVKARGVTTGEQFGPERRPPPKNPPRSQTGGDTVNDFEKAYNQLLKQTDALKSQADAEGLVGKAIDARVAEQKVLRAAEEAGIVLTAKDREETKQLAAEYANAKEQVAGLKIERDLLFRSQQLGRTADEAAAFAEVRSHGIDPESERGQELVQQTERLRYLTESKEMAGSFIKGMITDMENGVRAGKALENQLKRIADKLLDKTLDAALSGLFKAGGGLFGLGGGGADFGAEGGAIAEGDVITAAGGGIVGQITSRMRVPLEAFRGAKQFQAGGGVGAIVHPGELILSKAMQKNLVTQMGSGGGAPINVTHAPVINGVGASPEQISVMLARSQREFYRNIGTIFNDWQKRHGGGF